MSPRFLIGKELQNGKYRIVSFIGIGGMAEVYEGYDTKLKRKVAIKVLMPEYINNPYSVRRFYEEAEIAASCDHPHIVKIYDIHTEGDIHYFAMQFLFKSLTSILKERKKLPALEAVSVLKPIAEALTYLHSKRVVHKDIKPSNIMFDEHNHPILTDFGIAIRDDTTRFQGSVATGTPEYMSPEQIKGAELDSRSDIYSLGIILYELVTGKVPFEADDPQSVMYKHIHEPLPEKPLQDNQVPKRVRDILYKCLAKSPADRFQSPQVLVEALDDIIRNPLTPQMIRAKPRRLVKAKLLVPLFIAILILGVGVWFMRNTPNIKFFPSRFYPPFATISLSLQLDSIKDTILPFPAQILVKKEKEDTTFSIKKSYVVIKFYSDTLRKVANANPAVNEFSIYYPIEETLFKTTIFANVLYYEADSTEATVTKGVNSEIKIKLNPKARVCGRCGKEFSFADTICSSCRWPREK